MLSKPKYVPVNNLQVDHYICQLAKGDEQAFEQLYNMTAPAVYGYALTITKNMHDAQDVLHDTFVRVYQSATSYRSQRKPMAWILTIAKNLCYSRFRSKQPFAEIDDQTLLQQLADNPSMSMEDKMVVADCLQLLGEEERTIVVLHAMSGFKHKDIAKYLNLPLSTVLSKYNRAIKKLQTVLKGD